MGSYFLAPPAVEPHASRLSRIQTLEESIRDIEGQIEAAKRELLEALVEELPEEARSVDLDSLVLGDWYCPENGARLCVYNDVEDDVHDFCLFCGNPEERK